MAVRAFMKYPGSKQLMMSKLLRHIPRQGDILIECFAGSASVALNTSYKRYILNDSNKDLITLYKLVHDDPDAVIKETKSLFRSETNNPDYYYGIRDAFNLMTCLEDRAIVLLYLSRHGYNGLLRYNSHNQFNTPFGKYKKPYFPEHEMHFFAEKLEHAEFHSLDFSTFINLAASTEGKRDKICVYADPPYLKHDTQSSVFTEYTAQGFKHERHVELDRLLTAKKQHFDRVLLSNHDGHLLRETYKGAQRIVRFKVPRTISAKTKERKPAPEVLLYY